MVNLIYRETGRWGKPWPNRISSSNKPSCSLSPFKVARVNTARAHASSSSSGCITSFPLATLLRRQCESPFKIFNTLSKWMFIYVISLEKLSNIANRWVSLPNLPIIPDSKALFSVYSAGAATTACVPARACSRHWCREDPVLPHQQNSHHTTYKILKRLFNTLRLSATLGNSQHSAGDCIK